MAKDCKLCGGRMVYVPDISGYFHESSCNLEDWPICNDCMVDHCCRTNCLGCEYGKHTSYRFIGMKGSI